MFLTSWPPFLIYKFGFKIVFGDPKNRRVPQCMRKFFEPVAKESMCALWCQCRSSPHSAQYRQDIPGTSIVHPQIFYGYPVCNLYAIFRIRRISLGLIRILITCIFVWVKVVDEGWNFMLTFSVPCFRSGSNLLLTIETMLKG